MNEQKHDDRPEESGFHIRSGNHKKWKTGKRGETTKIDKKKKFAKRRKTQTALDLGMQSGTGLWC